MDGRPYMESMALASLSAVVAPRLSGGEDRKPNLFFITTDQQRWDALSLADNTMVIFTFGHGEMLGAHGMREKNTFDDEGALGRMARGSRFTPLG